MRVFGGGLRSEMAKGRIHEGRITSKVKCWACEGKRSAAAPGSAVLAGRREGE
jgi:hypothetical protein